MFELATGAVPRGWQWEWMAEVGAGKNVLAMRRSRARAHGTNEPLDVYVS